MEHFGIFIRHLDDPPIWLSSLCTGAPVAFQPCHSVSQLQSASTVRFPASPHPLWHWFKKMTPAGVNFKMIGFFGTSCKNAVIFDWINEDLEISIFAVVIGQKYIKRLFFPSSLALQLYSFTAKKRAGFVKGWKVSRQVLLMDQKSQTTTRWMYKTL